MSAENWRAARRRSRACVGRSGDKTAGSTSMAMSKTTSAPPLRERINMEERTASESHFRISMVGRSGSAAPWRGVP